MGWSTETIFNPIKISILKIGIFFLWNWGEKNFFKIGKYNVAKNAEYDSAWCADHKKVFFSPIKKSIFKIEIFTSEIEKKKLSLKLENRIG